MVSRYNNGFIIIIRGKKLIFEFAYRTLRCQLVFNIRIELTDGEIGYCGYPPQVMTTLRINILQHFNVNIGDSEDE